MKNRITVLVIMFLITVGIHNINAQIHENAKDVSPLLVGEKIPESNLINGNGEMVALDDILKEKPTVLVFYRGGWCPYCNNHLSALANSESKIIKLGYQIVAVSPDDYRNIKSTLEDDKVNYKVLSDPDGRFIQEMGLAFKAAEGTKKYITMKTTGKVTEVLPVPSIFVINRKRKIIFEYISPDYKNRISSELLLAVLGNVE